MSSIFDSFKLSFERYLDGYLHHIYSVEPLTEAYKYSIKNGGKRIRPILVYLGAFAVAPRNSFYSPEDLLVELAVGIELIHSYSLVHDDLPCMDNDTLRRGKPTTHAKYGAGMATIVGDAMLNGAAEVMLSALDNDFYMNCPYVKDNYKAQVNAAKYILKKAGIYGMVAGQCMDLKEDKSSYELNDYIRMNKLKTSALLKAALCAGALRFEASDEIIKAFEVYADNLGLVFQIVDDILDVTSTQEVLGKNIHSDIDHNKMTYLSFVGIEKAKQDCNIYAQKAIDAIKQIEDKINGAEYFYELVDKMLVREK